MIRADPGCPGVLYVGTETGLYASLDDGATWRRWRSNFPVTPVYDLEVEGTDLVIATHGRSFWILDDLTPLRRVAALRASGGRGVSCSPENGFRGSSRAGHHEFEAGVDDDTRACDFGLLSPPRSAWRLLPGVMDFITATDGKDYSVGLGKPATFVAARDDSGQVERSFLDAGESAAAGAIVLLLPSGIRSGRPGCLRSGVGQIPLGRGAVQGAVRSRSGARADLGYRGGGCRRGRRGFPPPLPFLDERGEVIREFRPKPAGYDKLSDEDKALDPGPWMPLRAGVNRFVWDLRYPGAKRLRGNKTGEEADRGPLVLPGTYTVRLRFGCRKPVSGPSRGPTRQTDEMGLDFAERTDGADFDVVNDPRSPATLEELRETFRLLLDIRDKISAAYEGVQRARDAGSEIERWCARLSRHGGHDAAVEAGQALREALAAVESALILPGEHTDTVGLHHRVRLNAALASVISIVDSADARPTAQARALAEEYMARIDDVLDRGKFLLDHDLGACNDLVSEAGLPPIDSN